ncbi:unnamed protein product [Parnassius apollo]|uniref:(apollo) hypothetical protein n=1 Tax=Parnassius apollo TaxID=110799 RepID=A0A8S3YCC9_PARAO|nr:unnamed protein product [Parnassius apollo]
MILEYHVIIGTEDIKGTRDRRAPSSRRARCWNHTASRTALALKQSSSRKPVSPRVTIQLWRSQRKKQQHKKKLAKDRLRKKEKYAEIKKDPEKYRLEKEKERKKYLLRKEKKKILSIAEITDRQKREQRRRWRKNSRKYLNKLKEQKKIERVLLENSPPTSENEEIANIADPDPLMEIEKTPKTVNSKATQSIQVNSSGTRKLRYRSMKVISNLKK